MIVVADTSLLVVLVNIGHTDLLPQLFGDLVIPPAVSKELRSQKRPKAVRDFMAARPVWIIERAPAAVDAIPSLHVGEREAICLATELKADLLIIDELRGREIAASRQIPFTGTIGVLESGANKGLLDLRDAFERVKQTDFWISADLLDERLRLWLSRTAPR